MADLADGRRCPRCAGETLTPFVAGAGVTVGFCGRCRGMLCGRGELERLAGGSLPRQLLGVDLEPLPGTRLVCPDCGLGFSERAVAGAEDVGVLECACGAAWIDGGTLPRLKAVATKRPSRPPSRPPLPPGVTPGTVPSTAEVRRALAEADADDEAGLRFGYGHPLVDLVTLPAAFAFAVLVAVGGVLDVFFIPAQIMFHELGHAIPAWFSSRSALPLPCGLTFWREEQSWFTAVCLLFLIGVLGHRGFREKRYFAVAVAAALAVAWSFMTVIVPAEGSMEIIIAGGLAGEVLVPTFAIVAFYFRMPDRARWDFWRFPILLPAAVTVVSAATLWVGVTAGTRRMPVGSIMGTPGDGSGDLERLMNGYDWTPAGIRGFYLSLALVALAGILGVYVLFGLRALARMRARR